MRRSFFLLLQVITTACILFAISGLACGHVNSGLAHSELGGRRLKPGGVETCNLRIAVSICPWKQFEDHPAHSLRDKRQSHAKDIEEYDGTDLLTGASLDVTTWQLRSRVWNGRQEISCQSRSACPFHLQNSGFPRDSFSIVLIETLIRMECTTL